MTVRQLAARYAAGKTAWSEYRSGARTVPLPLLRKVLDDVVPDARAKDRLWRRARALHAAAVKGDNAVTAAVPYGSSAKPAAGGTGTGSGTGRDDGPLLAVLGPVRHRRGAEWAPVGPPQRCALLAALLLREGRSATPAELVGDLWGAHAPPSAVAALRTHASGLRKTLGGRSVLLSDSGGYSLPVRRGLVDLHRAEEAAVAAQRAFHAGVPGEARALFADALSLWTGETLAGVPGPYAAAQRARLEEWRLTLLESRLELDVESGQCADTVSELTLLVAEHPYRERFRELLMLALHRSGRRREALAVFTDARRLLLGELGVEPGPRLAELHRRLLTAGPQQAGAGSRGSVDVVPIVKPEQLPAVTAHFTGRESVAAEIRARLTTADGPGLCAVSGVGGVGKTALALYAARGVRECFPDGQLHADLRGAGNEPADPHTVLGAFLRTLGMPDAAVPGGTDERAALYRSLLARRRVLVLLDNARDAAQVRPLLPGAEKSAVLVTSRARLVDLEDAHLVDLDLMPHDEAFDLFARIVGEERAAAERDAAREVVAACGRLPLALRIAASRLVARSCWDIGTLARRLRDENRRLDELHVGNLTVTAAFRMGYGHLEPAQARAFRLLALAEGPDISLDAAAALLGLRPHGAERVLESLVDASLLVSVTTGRFHFHDLVRLYARTRAEQDETAAERTAARSRLLDFYQGMALHVYLLGRPGDRLADHVAPAPVPDSAPADLTAAAEWLVTETDCILACVRSVARGSTLRRAADLLYTARDISGSGPGQRAYLEAAMAVLKAALKEQDAFAEGRVRLALALHLSVAGDLVAAVEHADRYLESSLPQNDMLTRSHGANVRGIISNYQGALDESTRWFTAALKAFREQGDRPGEASALNNLAMTYAKGGDDARALNLAEQALAIHSEPGSSSWRRANSLYTRGRALAGLGRYRAAARDFTHALEIFRDCRQIRWQAWAHWRLAQVHLADGSPAQAMRHAEPALSLVRSLGADRVEGELLFLLADALEQVGHFDRARACRTEAASVTNRKLQGLHDAIGRPGTGE
ncbi:tetratricopeptide repeat protein [Streptomyces sp. TYQ1024]|uniref:AfsR/SARP family transcriptional regulator n=2 Tax=Streptomyces TaxID=1883 RepID=UPI001EE5816A|nr:BTAD domain-containing putative transcriptional regulator [Streptomyces sp. TYQ1024]UKW30919.1 tetratricopeptide repeat protein [Streptomyces sp. TYQ1024]